MAEDWDWGFSIAYNAVLQAARAYMYSQGFRPASEQGHKNTFAFLRGELGEQAIRPHRITYRKLTRQGGPRWSHRAVGDGGRAPSRRPRGSDSLYVGRPVGWLQMSMVILVV